MRAFRLALLSGIALAAATAPAAALDKFSFGLSWLADAERGGYYQAKAAGIYEKHGLDVTIVPGGPQTNNPQLLLAGRLDGTLLSASLEAINYAKNDVPVVGVAALFQKNPQILMAHASQGYKSLADLKGKPILISSLSRNGYWLWLKSKYGYEDDQIRPYTFNLGVFLNDKATIQQGYVTYEPYSVTKQGAEPQVFLLADLGYMDYASVIGVKQETIATKRDVVQRFVNATIEGWYQLLYGDATPGLNLIKSINTQITDELLQNSLKVMREQGIVDSGDAKTMGIGAMTEPRIKALFDEMAKAGAFPEGDYWKRAFDVSFVNKKVGM